MTKHFLVTRRIYLELLNTVYYYVCLQLSVYSTKNSFLGKIEVPPSATVKDIKVQVAKLNPKLNVDRQSVRLDLKDKDKKDSTTISSLGLKSSSNIYIKDLGPQISWRTVFILEYLGPLVLYIIVATRPWIFYGDKSGDAYPFSNCAW